MLLEEVLGIREGNSNGFLGIVTTHSPVQWGRAIASSSCLDKANPVVVLVVVLDNNGTVIWDGAHATGGNNIIIDTSDMLFWRW